MRTSSWVLVSLGAGRPPWALVPPLLCALGSLGAGAAAGRRRCRCCVWLGAWVLVVLQAAAAVCVRLGGWALVSLRAAAATA